MENIEGCDTYIADFLKNRKLKTLDKRQLKQIEKHDYRLEKEIKKNPESLLKYRIADNSPPVLPGDRPIKSKCDMQFVNNLHWFLNNGSVMNEVNYDKYCAFDFARNTKLNRTDFTKYLQSLNITSSTKVPNKWLIAAADLTKPGSRVRSRSAPNVRLNEKKPYDRFEKGYKSWCEEYFSIYNADAQFGIPTDLGLAQSKFAKSMTLSMSNIAESFDPIKLSPGWTPITAVLFSTFDNHFYALLKQSSIKLEDFSRYCADQLASLHTLPQHHKKDWTYQNVIINLEKYRKNETQFRRARHICSIGEDDYFIELDTGKVRVIRRAGVNDVMKLPTQQLIYPTPLYEFRFENMNLTEIQMTHTIENIRKAGKLYICGFDKTDKRVPYCYILKSQDIIEQNRPTIKTAIVASTMISHSQPPHSMTTAFCGHIDCMGCNGLRYFKH